MSRELLLEFMPNFQPFLIVMNKQVISNVNKFLIFKGILGPKCVYQLVRFRCWISENKSFINSRKISLYVLITQSWQSLSTVLLVFSLQSMSGQLATQGWGKKERKGRRCHLRGKLHRSFSKTAKFSRNSNHHRN